MRSLLPPLAILLFLPLLGHAQTTTYNININALWQTPGLMIVPNTSTAIISQTTLVDKVVLANTSGSAVTVTMTDQSTNCNSAACQILPAVSIAANTVYVVNLGGVTATGGVKWVASTANAIHGWAQGRY